MAASAVTGNGNFAMTAASIATCAKVLLDRKDQGESPSGVLGVDDVVNLAEVTKKSRQGQNLLRLCRSSTLSPTQK